MTALSPHEIAVDAWLERSRAPDRTRDVLLDLFEAAVLAIWSRSSIILGEVTLTAIAGRVLHTAAERYPAFGSLEVESNGRVHSRELRENVEAIQQPMLVEGLRFVLVEFLTVLGNLTANLLTRELHAELGGVHADPDAAPKVRRAASSIRLKTKDHR